VARADERKKLERLGRYIIGVCFPAGAGAFIAVSGRR